MFPTNLSLETISNNNFKPTNNYKDSQNSMLFDYLKRYVEYWDNLIHEEGADISDFDLINEAMNKDLRVMVLRENGLGSDVINTYNNLLVQLANANLKYREVYYSTKDTEKAESAELAEAKKTADNIRQQINDLRQGVFADDFLDKAIFRLNRTLEMPLFTPDIYMYARSINKDYSTADEATKAEIEKSYQEYMKNNENAENLAYKVFKISRDLVQNDIKNVNEVNIKYLEELNNNLRQLFNEYKLEGFVTEEDIKNLIKDKRQGKSNDEIISLYGLNQKQDALTDLQKEALVEKFLKSEVEKDINSKSSDTIIKYFQLGLDPKFFGDTERLSKVIQILSELKSKYGYIDSDTADKVRRIIDKVNVKDFSIKDIVHKFIESGASLDNYDFKADTEVLETLRPIINNEDEFNDLENFGVSSLKLTRKTDENNKEYYELTLASNAGEYTRGLDLNKAENLILDVLAIESPVNSLLEYNNTTDSSIIDNLKKIETPDENAVRMIESANKLLEGDIVNDLGSRLLGKISNAVYGEDITELYKNLLNALTAGKSITDFIINNPDSDSKLESLIKSADLLISILSYSTKYKNGTSNPNLFDFITVVNGFRNSKGLEELQTLTPQATEQIANQINEISFAAKIMKDVSDVNKAGKIKENKIVHTRITAS